jgi:hypothetical protein
LKPDSNKTEQTKQNKQKQQKQNREENKLIAQQKKASGARQSEKSKRKGKLKSINQTPDEGMGGFPFKLSRMETKNRIPIMIYPAGTGARDVRLNG